MPVTQQSKPITRMEANAYIKNYQETQDIIQKAAIAKFEVQTDTMGKRALNMSKCEWNAFIFTKESILDFFGIKELQPRDPKKNCEYLAVILGAYGDNESPKKPGEITVMVAGVNKKQGSEDELVTLNWPEPARQHPPTRVVDYLPDPNSTDSNNQITFKILQ